MALSADRLLEFVGPVEVLRVSLTASVTYYKGGMVQWDASTGLAKKAAADVAGEFGFGVLKKGYASSASAQDGEVITGKIWIPFTSAAQSDVGDWVYCTDDGTITKTALTNGGPCGRIIDVRVGVSALVDFTKGGPKTLAA